MKGVCDVCFYVDKDKTTKNITYCEFCNAFICNECENNYLKRAKAALIKLFKNGSTKT